jgi:hypothetical protein
VVCEADGTPPLPISVDTVMAWWASRILGSKLKSSALKSVTSRLLTHASLLGHEAPPDVVTAIGRERQYFCAAFPCEVSSAAPPLGDAGDGRLSTAIAFAGARAEQSLFFRVLHTLLLTSRRCTAVLQLSSKVICGGATSSPSQRLPLPRVD